MSIYSNVTEQDLMNLRKLAEQQKEQRARKIKKRTLKHTHDVNLAESLSAITKKLDEVNESTKKVGDIKKNHNLKKTYLNQLLNTLHLLVQLKIMKV